jgi:hypothetical protein
LRSADVAVVGALVVTFAVLVTAHLCIVAGLFYRAPRWRSVVALFVGPLAPYWALRNRMYVRGVAWLVAAVCYVIVRGLAV